MKSILTLSFVACNVLLGGLLGWNIAIALGTESLFVAGPRLAADAWGWVTLLDLYLGFLVFGGYLAARERSAARVVPWLIAVLCLGNLASAAYVLWALHRNGYDVAALVRPARV